MDHLNHHIYHDHNSFLVFISIIVAILASYVAIDLLKSAKLVRSKKNIFSLILLGGIAIGTGVWSAHFIGMLAFKIPGIEIYYDIPLMFLSIIVAIIPSVVSLWILAVGLSRAKAYVFGAFFLAMGICGMHYIGIWSMEVPMRIIWDPLKVFTSILFALGFSYAAYFVAFNLKKELIGFKILGSIGLGLAVGSMHYMAMAAMDFIPVEDYQRPDGFLIDSQHLISIVIFSTMVILIISAMGIAFNKAYRRQEAFRNHLEEGIKQRDEFLSLSSHELKTPLTAMKMDLELTERKMKNETLNSKEMSFFVSRQKEAINRVVRIVDDMIEASKISAGDVELVLEEVNLGELVAEALEKVKPVALLHGNNLEFKISEEINVVVDKLRIEQVIYHLVHNSIQYAPESEILLKVVKQDNEVILSIIDGGRGIPRNDFKLIFKRYERGRNVGDTRGLGLGLYIASEVIGLHRGRIEVDSEIGKGAEFRVYLPH